MSSLDPIGHTHRTGAANWFVAGCHSGIAGIGMESAVESGMTAANCLLEGLGTERRIPIEPYTMNLTSRLAAHLGAGLLRWKYRGKSPRRLSENRYS